MSVWTFKLPHRFDPYEYYIMENVSMLVYLFFYIDRDDKYHSVFFKQPQGWCQPPMRIREREHDGETCSIASLLLRLPG